VDRLCRHDRASPSRPSPTSCRVGCVLPQLFQPRVVAPVARRLVGPGRPTPRRRLIDDFVRSPVGVDGWFTRISPPPRTRWPPVPLLAEDQLGRPPRGPCPGIIHRHPTDSPLKHRWATLMDLARRGPRFHFQVISHARPSRVIHSQLRRFPPPDGLSTSRICGLRRGALGKDDQTTLSGG